MGCKKKNKLTAGNNVKKIVLAVLVSMMWIACFTPVVFSDEDTITITFDPTGAVNLEVSPITYNFSTVAAEGWENTSGDTFTLWNNGTIRMDAQIKVCHTKNLTVDDDGGPAVDSFSLRSSGLSNDAYIPYAYAAYQSQDLNPGSTDPFDLCLNLGTVSENFTWQQAYVNFSGSAG